MSTADDVKKTGLRPGCKGSAAFAPATVLITTERRLGQRTFNGVFPQRSPPHLASEPLPGKSSLQTTSPSCFPCSQIHATSAMPHLSRRRLFFSSYHKFHFSISGLKRPGIEKFFAHLRDFHALLNVSPQAGFAFRHANEGLNQRKKKKGCRGRRRFDGRS